MKEGFYLDSRTALVFFRICRMFGVEGYDERVALMRKMVARKKVKYIRDGEAFLKGKRVLGFKQERP